jgi:foldase protein PrsA
MSEYLAERVPTVGEQVFINMLPVEDYQVGLKVKERLDGGESWAAMVERYSQDEDLKENGGAVGWYPRGVLTYSIDSTAFELEVGAVSDPFYVDDENVILIMVSEKVDAREIEEESLNVIKAKALDNWVTDEYQYHKVRFHGFNNGYDSETDAWVRWQLQRMRQGRRPEEEQQAGGAR